MHGYADRALRYARAVVAGEIVACKWTRLACERQLKDLERSEADAAWPWRFDVDAAERPFEIGRASCRERVSKQV